ncbi:MAG: hypothetical protein IKO80_10485 [Lachnospiraceae bacterium]|nr:hypothetical protein [Lachnospiraceae bacterium]
MTLTVSLKAGTIPQADSGPYTDELQIKRIEVASGGYLKADDGTGEPAGITGNPNEALQIGIPIDLEVMPAFSVTPAADAQNGGAVDLGEAMVGQTLEPVTFMIRNNGTVSRNFMVRVYKSDVYTLHESLLADKDPDEAIEVKAGARLAVTVSSGELTAAGEMTGRLQITANGISREIPLKAAAIDAPTGLAIKAVPDQYYDGTAKKPVPQVWFGNTKLADTDYTVTYANNTNAALKDSNKPPTVTVRGKGNFAGSCSASFNILPRPVADAEAENDALVRNGSLPANQILTANGGVQKGRFVLKYTYEDGRELTLKENTDYTLDYQGIDPKEAGLYTVTVRGKGNYTGSRTVTLAIVDPREKTLISKTTIPAIPNQVYSGKGYILRAAGAVCGAEQTFALDASKKQFAFTIKKGGQVLRYGRDYTLTYADNREVGTATVTIIGTGDAYTGSVTKTFKITGKPLASVKQTGFIAKPFYTGSPVSQPLVFHDAAKDVDRDLEEGRDYTVTCLEGEATEPGTYNLVYTGKGLYTGSVKKSFTIVSDIRLCLPEGLEASYEWTGSPIDPFGMSGGAGLMIGGRTLRKGTDYSCAITNNVNPGTATITFTGNAPYTGTLKKTFRIVPCSLPQGLGRIITRVPGGDPADFVGAMRLAPWPQEQPNQWYSADYRKSGVKPEPTIMDTLNSRVMVSGRDYTLQWSNHTATYTRDDRGSDKRVPTVTITGKGTYTGRITLSYYIQPASINPAPIPPLTITATDVYYADQPGFYRRTAVRVTDPDGKVLSANTDYCIEEYGKFVPDPNSPGTMILQPLTADDKPDPGTQIKVKIKGMGNYYGSNGGTYHVLKYNIASANITIADQTYADGEYIEPGPEAFPDVKVKIGGKDVVLKYGEAFEANRNSFENNRMPGTARVKIYGNVGWGYGGTKIVTFKIKKREANDNSIIVRDPDNNEWTKDHRPKVSYSPAGCRPRPLEVYYRDPNGNLTGLNPVTDYALSWRNNTKCAEADGSASDPIVTITFKGNYTGKVERHFSIEKAKLLASKYDLDVSQKLEPVIEKVGDGTERLTGMKFKYSGMTAVLTENESGKKIANTDYTVVYDYMDDTAKIRRLENGEYVESGTAKYMNVKDGDIIPLGTGLIAVVEAAEGENRNYTGRFYLEGDCEIRVMAPVNLASATITPPDLEYEPHRIIGEGQVADESTITAPEDRFEVKVRIGTKTMILDPDCYGLTDWKNNHHAGTAQVTVRGIESKGYGGSKTVNVKINPFSLTDRVENAGNPDIRMQWQVGNDWYDYVDVRRGESAVISYEYTTSVVMPRPDMINGIFVSDDLHFNEYVSEGEDYTITYRNNKKSYVFGKGQKTEAEIKELKKNAPAVIFTGKGDYCGSCELYFSITPAEIDDRCTVTVPDVIWQDKAGNFKLRSQDVTVTDKSVGKLKAGTDYCNAEEFKYYNWSGKPVTVIRPGETEPVPVLNRTGFQPDDIVPAGTRIKVWITGKGNYRGNGQYASETSANYYLLYANNLNTAAVTIKDQDYTGGEINLTEEDIKVSMRVGGKTMDLEKGTHYKIVYEGDHTKAGTVKVRIEGIPSGGFKGSKAATFKIKAYTMK